MNKSELVAHIANATDLSKAEATRALEAIVETVTASLKDGEDVTLVGC